MGGGSPTPRARRGPSRTVVLGVGLLLTLGGLFLLSDLLPSKPAALVHALPIAGGGILALWVGGILLGRGGRP